MTTKHKITTELQYRFPINHEGEYESAYPEVEVAFSMLPGSPQTHDDPGCGPELEFISARIIKSDGVDPDADDLAELAEEWLDGEGRDAAIEIANQDISAARADAMEHSVETRREIGRLFND